MNRTQSHVPPVALGMAGHVPFAVQNATQTHTQAATEPAETRPKTAAVSVPVSAAIVEAPRTWQFTDPETGQPSAFTCMLGCTIDHQTELTANVGFTSAVDVQCQTDRNEATTLPIDTDGTPEEFRVLAFHMALAPFSPHLAERMPHLTVEVIDDHWVTPLDPDGLATVISTLQGRLDQLHAAHTELTRVRDEYRGRS